MSRVVILFLVLLSSFTTFAQNVGMEMLYPVRLDDKWGYINQKGEMLIEPQFDYASRYVGKLGDDSFAFFAHVVQDDKNLVINLKGDQIADFGSQNITLLNHSFFAAQKPEGVELGTFKSTKRSELFDRLVFQTSNGFIVLKNGKYGVIGNDLNELLPPIYSWILPNPFGFGLIDNVTNGFYFSESGVLIPPIYKELQVITEDIAWVKLDSTKFGAYFARTGKIEVPCGPNISLFQDQILYERVSSDSSVLWDFKNKTRFRLNYRVMSVLREAPLCLHVADGWGRRGIWRYGDGLVTELRYTRIDTAGNNFLLSNAGKMVLADSLGNIVSDTNYRFIYKHGEYFVVRKDNLVGIINQNGDELIPPSFKYIHTSETIFKAYMGDAVVMYELQNGRVIDRMRIPNVVTPDNIIRIDDPEDTEVLAGDDHRQNIWFQDSASGLWGLRSRDFDTLITPRYYSARSIPGTPYAIASKRFDNADFRGLKNALYPIDNHVLYAVVHEDMGRPLTAPIYAFIDEENLKDSTVSVVRVRDVQGGYRLVNKYSGRLGSQVYSLMDTFISGRARVLLQGNISVGDIRQSLYRRYQEIGTMADVVMRSGYTHFQNSNTRLLNNNLAVHVINGYWSYVDTDGRLININSAERVEKGVLHGLNNRIEYAGSYADSTAPIYYQDRWHFANMNGHFPDSVSYRTVHIIKEMNTPQPAYLASELNPRMGMVGPLGNVMGDLQYNRVRPMRDGVAWARKGREWGLLTADGQWKTIEGHAIFDVQDFEDGLGVARISRDWYVVDTDLNYYEVEGVENVNWIGKYSEGLCPIRVLSESKGYQYGFIDRDQKLVIPLRYSRVEGFKNGFAKVRDGNNQFFIDRNGNKIGPKFDLANNFRGDYAVFQKRGQWGVISSSGDVIVKPKYTKISVGEQFIHAHIEKQLDIYDSLGNVVLTYEDVSLMKGISDGMNAIRLSGKMGYINEAGEIIFEPEYSFTSNFENGFAVAGSRKEKFVINDKGDTLFISEDLSTRSGFSDGMLLAAVQKNGRTGYVFYRHNLMPLTADTFERAMPFQYGMAAVQKNGKWGMIDSAGRLVVPYEYGQILHWGSEHVAVRANAIFGIISGNGNEYLPVDNDVVDILEEENLVWVMKGEENGYLNFEGKWVWHSEGLHLRTGD